MNGALEKIFIEDIQEGQEVSSPFLISDMRLAQTRTGKPYVGLKLRDCTGEMEARVWEGAEKFHETFRNGVVAWVQGSADSFQGQVQLKIHKARAIEPGQFDPAHFVPASEHDVDAMFRELSDIVHSVSDGHLRGLLLDFLFDERFSALLKRSPAAKRFHHAYLGGLLEHTLCVSRAALAVSSLYPALNRDLLITGAVLHDAGKVWEFDQGLEGDYTDEGRLLGHLLIGVRLVEEKLAGRPDFPPGLALLVKHLIVSHHGEYELGSPKRPKIMEALVLHMIDDLDAKMNGIGGFIQRHADAETGWTDFNRLMGRFFYQHHLPSSGGDARSAEFAPADTGEAGAEDASGPGEGCGPCGPEQAGDTAPKTKGRAAAKQPAAEADDIQMSFLED